MDGRARGREYGLYGPIVPPGLLDVQISIANLNLILTSNGYDS
jgi:hypothetical protein